MLLRNLPTLWVLLPKAIYFKCAIYERLRCHARAILRDNGEFTETQAHNHPADPDFVGLRHFRQNVLRRIRPDNTHMNYQEIVEAERRDRRCLFQVKEIVEFFSQDVISIFPKTHPKTGCVCYLKLLNSSLVAYKKGLKLEELFNAMSFINPVMTAGLLCQICKAVRIAAAQCECSACDVIIATSSPAS